MIRRLPPGAAGRLTAAFLAGPWTAAEMVRRGREAVDLGADRMRRLVRRVRLVFGPAPPLGDAELLEAAVARFLARCRFADRGAEGAGEPGPPRRTFWYEPAMGRAAPPADAWERIPLATGGDLARWLELEPGVVEWLADRRRSDPEGPEARRHYRYEWHGRRLIEAPKPRLKAVQRRILAGILDEIPPHPAAVAFRRGRSVVDAAAAHVGRPVVVRLDLRDFFATVRRARVRALFRRLGYPVAVAERLAALTTHATPSAVWASRPAAARESASLDGARGQRFRTPHLPQGAPTSPALANLCAFALDVRLDALARAFGAVYTRYADDLVFSGDLRGRTGRLIRAAEAIVRDEGFVPHPAKTRVMPASGRQVVAGVVVNVRPNLPREELDRLEAILTNCVRCGPDGQNRDGVADWRGHLRGRVAWVEQVAPQRGARLRALFDRIRWV